jgi:hypothetical protein
MSHCWTSARRLSSKPIIFYAKTKAQRGDSPARHHSAAGACPLWSLRPTQGSLSLTSVSFPTPPTPTLRGPGLSATARVGSISVAWLSPIHIPRANSSLSSPSPHPQEKGPRHPQRGLESQTSRSPLWWRETEPTQPRLT